MTEVFAPLVRLVSRDGIAALVTVTGAKGSTPREAGARMIVASDGALSGTIGGGRLELEALEMAMAAMAAGGDGAEGVELALGPSIGQCCGGSVSLLIETFTISRLAALTLLRQAERDGPFQTEAVVRAGTPVERRVVATDRQPASAGLDARGRLTESFGEPPRQLLLFGAGHVGRAVVLTLAPLPFHVRWIDSRDSVFPDLPFARLDRVVTGTPAAELAVAPADAFVLIMTHDHALDLDILDAALRQDRFPYVGLIGSQTKRARFEHRLLALGHPLERSTAFTCPIGVAGISSKDPAHIAVSVVAELLIVDEKTRRTERAAPVAAESAGCP